MLAEGAWWLQLYRSTCVDLDQIRCIERCMLFYHVKNNVPQVDSSLDSCFFLFFLHPPSLSVMETWEWLTGLSKLFSWGEIPDSITVTLVPMGTIHLGFEVNWKCNVQVMASPNLRIHPHYEGLFCSGHPKSPPISWILCNMNSSTITLHQICSDKCFYVSINTIAAIEWGVHKENTW